MRRIVIFTLIAACGGKVEETPIDPGASSGSAAGAIPTGTSTSVPPSAPSPGQPTPTPAPKDPAPAGKKVLTAIAMPGGLDHIVVFAADPIADSCVKMHLTHPDVGGAPYWLVDTPKDWQIMDIARWPDASKCTPGKQPPPSERADNAKGTVSWVVASGQVYPCSIDVHVAAIFKGNPTVEQLDGDKIPVAKCQ